MPNVEYARIGGAYHLHAASYVLSVEHHVFAAPADDVLIEAADFQEVRAEKKLKNEFWHFVMITWIINK